MLKKKDPEDIVMGGDEKALGGSRVNANAGKKA